MVSVNADEVKVDEETKPRNLGSRERLNHLGRITVRFRRIGNFHDCPAGHGDRKASNGHPVVIPEKELKGSAKTHEAK